MLDINLPIPVALVGGLLGLVAGGELVVRGAARLAAGLGISPVVIGLTVVAFGTSAPELAVGVGASLGDAPGIAIGNVVGSNIWNVALVLGASALIAPLAVDAGLVRRELPLIVIVSFAAWWLASDGLVSTLDGVLLAAALLVYLTWTIVSARREPDAIREEFAQHFGPSDPVMRWAWNIGLVVVGIGLLVVGADQLVAGASGVARALGWSELVIGLTIVAVGTSLPELMTSLVATVRGERDIAVGNVVGSNLFNLLCVLGLTAVVVPTGVHVDERALAFDFPAMVITAALAGVVLFGGIGRPGAFVFIAAGAIYLGLSLTIPV